MHYLPVANKKWQRQRKVAVKLKHTASEKGREGGRVSASKNCQMHELKNAYQVVKKRKWRGNKNKESEQASKRKKTRTHPKYIYTPAQCMNYDAVKVLRKRCVMCVEGEKERMT